METNDQLSSKEEKSKRLNEKEKRDYIKEKTLQKINNLKELLKSLGLDNIGDIMSFLQNIESMLDGLDLNELKEITQKIQDEITISIEKDNRLKSGDKLKFAMLLNGDTVNTNFSDDDQFAYL